MKGDLGKSKEREKGGEGRREIDSTIATCEAHQVCTLLSESETTE